MNSTLSSEIIYSYIDFDGKLVNVIKAIKNGVAIIKQKLTSVTKEVKTKISKTKTLKGLEKGMIVQPNHKGQDISGRIIDWSVYQGAVKSEPYFNHDGTDKELMVDIVWFGEAKGCMPRNYYVRDLDWTGRYWDKMR